jgi:hypothetical protein
MTIAYLILAHDKPRQLERLAAALLARDPAGEVVIHLDRGKPIWRERAALSLPARARVLANPVAVRWGHWSQTAATHLLIREALTGGCDAAHLISGADWPIADPAEVAAELAHGRCYIEAGPSWLEQRMQTFRLDGRWLKPAAPGPLARQTLWELRRLSRWAERLRDAVRAPRSRPYGPWLFGSQWWSLPRDVLEVVDVELARLLASRRLAGTVCSDEHAIPTIVGHRFADRLAPDNRRFLLWPTDASSPLTLTRTHRADIAISGAWFARKFDEGVDDFFMSLGAATPSPDASAFDQHRTHAA